LAYSSFQTQSCPGKEFEFGEPHCDSESNIKIPEGLFRAAMRPTASFTGRETFLKVLHESAIQKTNHPEIFALVGNGCMGKNQIALKHAHGSRKQLQVCLVAALRGARHSAGGLYLHCQGSPSARMGFEGYGSDSEDG
jgi:hypothetical protein